MLVGNFGLLHVFFKKKVVIRLVGLTKDITEYTDAIAFSLLMCECRQYNYNNNNKKNFLPNHSITFLALKPHICWQSLDCYHDYDHDDDDY